MPAEKAHRVSLGKRVRNRAARRTAKTAVGQAAVGLIKGDLAKSQESVAHAITVLDKAAQKGAIHPNNAARRKSRLMKKFNRAHGKAAD